MSIFTTFIGGLPSILWGPIRVVGWVIDWFTSSGEYPELPVPPAYRGPSGEPGQILLDGIAMRVSVFHGRVDDELDWHVYIDPDPSVWQTMAPFLRSNGVKIRNHDLAHFYCEFMVLDKFQTPFLGDDKFFSADVTEALRLSKHGSQHAAWDFGLMAMDDQTKGHDVSDSSRLVRDGGRVYLQGAFVNDADHETDSHVQVEIHPLDSIAFAMTESGTTISARWGQSDWPSRFVRWRVAVVANSDLHRINRLDYMKRDRATTWWLDFPGAALAEDEIGPQAVRTFTVVEEAVMLWDGDKKELYDSYGVKSRGWDVVFDPSVGRGRLKVDVTMRNPDDFGGIIIRDYVIRRQQQVSTPPIG
jgi:hypothetical protein